MITIPVFHLLVPTNMPYSLIKKLRAALSFPFPQLRLVFTESPSWAEGHRDSILKPCCDSCVLLWCLCLTYPLPNGFSSSYHLFIFEGSLRTDGNLGMVNYLLSSKFSFSKLFSLYLGVCTNSSYSKGITLKRRNKIYMIENRFSSFTWAF